ncbi:geranylgeranyltransferase type I beta-subunit-like protein [Gonapodya prolifera JEL478]|uniref:Geranylgeranyl transferase type-1 subunit beta n=1 Tax=Gonapodya prolifera (strain JEL478) TaxID=1344416 RepID=A0A139A761_GONPJ|nr:geranylgeranyltransferase type I beta-subunit-like protein [Gonapodya prolifera JEL478]|eukprot:KXS12656.1 geranylgeranyltransferase type I beta-subunit-like protein [Gonapodya prolifera JEL478]
MDSPDFLREKHVRYFKQCLKLLPRPYTGGDTNRMTFVYFALGALDLLGVEFDKDERDSIVEWIYAQQILPDPQDRGRVCGFRGAPFMGTHSRADGNATFHPYDGAHITMTYTAIQCLLILRDDLSRVDRSAITAGLAKLQQPDGSFAPIQDGMESDMRFLYCACAVSYMLNDWSGVDIDSAVRYISDSRSYDFGFGQGPHLESHGGSTYCALASLWLMCRHDTLREYVAATTKWCLSLQDQGFHGRQYKQDDTCYSFWIGASLHLLSAGHLINDTANIQFLMTTQNKMIGGFGKYQTSLPDILHSYMGLAGLSLGEFPGVQSMSPALNLTDATVKFLASEAVTWKRQ